MASCWPLLKRWISSMNKIVRCPLAFLLRAASSITLRRSATPAVTALSGTKYDLETLAMTRASVVLPLPGGPHNMMEGSWSDSMALRKTLPSPMICRCPTYSLKFCGRRRAARGMEAVACSGFAPAPLSPCNSGEPRSKSVMAWGSRVY